MVGAALPRCLRIPMAAVVSCRACGRLRRDGRPSLCPYCGAIPGCGRPLPWVREQDRRCHGWECGALAAVWFAFNAPLSALGVYAVWLLSNRPGPAGAAALVIGICAAPTALLLLALGSAYRRRWAMRTGAVVSGLFTLDALYRFAEGGDNEVELLFYLALLSLCVRAEASAARLQRSVR